MTLESVDKSDVMRKVKGGYPKNLSRKLHGAAFREKNMDVSSIYKSVEFVDNNSMEFIDDK